MAEIVINIPAFGIDFDKLAQFASEIFWYVLGIVVFIWAVAGICIWVMVLAEHDSANDFFNSFEDQRWARWLVKFVAYGFISMIIAVAIFLTLVLLYKKEILVLI